MIIFFVVTNPKAVQPAHSWWNLRPGRLTPMWGQKSERWTLSWWRPKSLETREISKALSLGSTLSFESLQWFAGCLLASLRAWYLSDCCDQQLDQGDCDCGAWPEWLWQAVVGDICKGSPGEVALLCCFPTAWTLVCYYHHKGRGHWNSETNLSGVLRAVHFTPWNVQLEAVHRANFE